MDADRSLAFFVLRVTKDSIRRNVTFSPNQTSSRVLLPPVASFGVSPGRRAGFCLFPVVTGRRMGHRRCPPRRDTGVTEHAGRTGKLVVFFACFETPSAIAVCVVDRKEQLVVARCNPKHPW